MRSRSVARSAGFLSAFALLGSLRCASMRVAPSTVSGPGTSAAAPRDEAPSLDASSSPRGSRREADASALFVLRVSDETEYADGGALDAGYVARAGLAFRELDAGAAPFAADGTSGPLSLESSEVGWLVAHIAEGADAANPSDGPHVRALAARGSEGVRAVIALFRAGDAQRVPFARRVLERVATRACRARPNGSALALLRFIELGLTTRAVADAGRSFLWERGIAIAWPRDAVQRLTAWADEGALCRAPSATLDAGAP